MPVSVRVGANATMTRVVTAQDTAEALGSGDVPVLGTPRVLAWCEAATVRALKPALDDGQTSVGTRVELVHLAPTPIGDLVTVTATVVAVAGGKVRFGVAVTDGGSRLMASGTLTRVVVERAKFLPA